MLDTDHFFLSRTTSFMIHGESQNNKRQISYALMTDNGEDGLRKNFFRWVGNFVTSRLPIH